LYTRIMLPLDGSELAERAVPHAAKLAERSGAALILVMVVEPLPPIHRLGVGAVERASAQAKGMAREYLDRLASGLQERGLSVEVHTPEGPVYQSLLSFVRENDVDLIAMSSRGHSGPSRWLMGSVADRVVRGAPVPVLLIPFSQDPS
jgi:nucleotide-binding universal stress UspA family protein